MKNNKMRNILISFNVFLSTFMLFFVIDYIVRYSFLKEIFSIILFISLICCLHLGWVYFAKINEDNLAAVKRGYILSVIGGIVFIPFPFILSIVMLVNSFIVLNHLGGISKKINNRKTLHQKIAEDMGLGDVEHKKIYLPFKFIGGFMTPLIPTQIVENKNRIKDKRLAKHEIIIHELMHIKIMKKLFFPFVLFIGLLSYLLFAYFDINLFLGNVIMILIVSFCLTMNEKITFDMTRKYSIKKRMQPTRKFTYNNFKRYMFIYIIQISFLIGFFELIKLVINKII